MCNEDIHTGTTTCTPLTTGMQCEYPQYVCMCAQIVCQIMMLKDAQIHVKRSGGEQYIWGVIECSQKGC